MKLFSSIISFSLFEIKWESKHFRSHMTRNGNDDKTRFGCHFPHYVCKFSPTIAASTPYSFCTCGHLCRSYPWLQSHITSKPNLSSCSSSSSSSSSSFLLPFFLRRGWLDEWQICGLSKWIWDSLAIWFTCESAVSCSALESLSANIQLRCAPNADGDVLMVTTAYELATISPIKFTLNDIGRPKSMTTLTSKLNYIGKQVYLFVNSSCHQANIISYGVTT